MVANSPALMNNEAELRKSKLSKDELKAVCANMDMNPEEVSSLMNEFSTVKAFVDYIYTDPWFGIEQECTHMKPGRVREMPTQPMLRRIDAGTWKTDALQPTGW
eukprot:gnl/MRDRNA2_/MRDRNA2_29974_c0_seq2.p1 gnl/MRDRNA2_/MRDRNA2_29974_c0~~gnl/MRDRNA2_/MRDRNA2_29974_c0_seq2.p1  ORF type:complete len:104 (-),score=17.00 gnl/MRDRNA2_/MRDRNA2_29974_c0_seq2:426-737(-)